MILITCHCSKWSLYKSSFLERIFIITISNEGEGPSRKRSPNFKTDEITFLLNKIRKSKGILFGALSARLTFTKKIETWLKIRDELFSAGYPKRTREQLKKKWEDLSSGTKVKYNKKMITGGGAVEWHAMDDIITDILGKDNPSLTSIPVGIDSSKLSTNDPQTSITSPADDCNDESADELPKVSQRPQQLVNVDEIENNASGKADND
jgi:hypothetical protein